MDKRSKELRDMMFSQRNLVTIPSSSGGPIRNPEEVLNTALTALRNINSIGFSLDEQGYRELLNLNKDDIVEWYTDTSAKLLELTGGDRIHEPFYPNFPDDYIDHNDIERVIEQLAHYWVGYRPDEKNEKEGIKSLEDHPLKTLASIKEEDLPKEAQKVFINLLSSKMNVNDKDIYGFIEPYVNSIDTWTDDVVGTANRKTMCGLYAMAIKQGKSTKNFPELAPNDILRIANNLGLLKENPQGDNLSEMIRSNDIRLVPLPKNQYRALVKTLATPADSSTKRHELKLEDSIARYKQQWKRFFGYAHIHAEKAFGGSEYDAIKEASKALYDDKLRTYYSRVEKAFEEGDYNKILQIYKERPGEFVKNINRLVSTVFNNEKDEKKVNEFGRSFVQMCKEVLPSVKTEDLFSLDEYIRSRGREDRVRVHNVKGHFYVPDKEYDPLPGSFVTSLSFFIRDTIKEQIAQKDLWEDKKVYIDPELKNLAVPGKDRSESSSSMESYTKGSKLPIEKNGDEKSKDMRIFIWWTNLEGEGYDKRVDIDLSVNLYNEEKEYVAHMGYSNTSALAYGCKHSGDITNGGPANGRGVTEYIDIPIERLKEEKIRYVSAVANVYCGVPFKDLNCQFGWMEREELDKTEQFDIKAVKQKSDLTANANGIIPAIIDTYEGKVIWTDTPDFHITQGSSAMKTVNNVSYLIDKYGTNDRMNMHELARIAVAANGGEITDEPERAQIVFTKDAVKNKTEEQEVITSKDQDVWIERFMTSHIIPKPDTKERDKKRSNEKTIYEEIAAEFEKSSDSTAISKSSESRTELER